MQIDMRVLVVEDDLEFVSDLVSAIGSAVKAEVVIAHSRDSALERLSNEFFDLVVLDLKIPTTDGHLGAATEHGLAVFTKAQQLAPGTPICILTGSPAETFIPDLLRRQHHVDIWGDGVKVGVVQFLKKWDFKEFPGLIQSMAQAVHRLADVELSRTNEVDLSVAEDRLVRIFARRRSGVHCALTKLGGLSGSKVLRITVTGSDGGIRDRAVAKLGTLQEIEAEAELYDRHVTRLEPVATPRRLETIQFGARDRAGVFYSLAEGYERSLFELVREKDPIVPTALVGLAHVLTKWSDGVPWQLKSITDVRRRLLSDKSAQLVISTYGLDWAGDFEALSIYPRWCCTHGDLHGGNVLVNRSGAPALIDYGDIADGPPALDPVTLELSAIFHPEGVFYSSEWPAIETAKKWGELDAYLSGCPYPDFVGGCREWALRVATGSREIAATAYSYLLRQLKYPDTNKDRALALIDGVRAYYEST